MTRELEKPAVGQMGDFDIAKRYARLDFKNHPLVKIGAKLVRHGRYVAFQLNCHGFGGYLANVG